MQEISLLELSKEIKNTIHNKFNDSYWVVAEISEIREVRNGHCYLEVIEKDEVKDIIVAKMRANIWAYTYRMMKPYFESVTGQNLSAGLKIMVRASVDYSEQYGISLNIRDIDPTYTLGDVAKQRQITLNRLREDGVINMNKELNIPLVPQKIAIISSPTAAGYEDFCNQLNNNEYSYKFYTKLFPAVMQGNQAEESIVDALNNIFEYEDFFDVVVIIRGGGSTSDLMCFDNYWIAYNIAQFPIPVLSGIGHERDESIVDYVAHTRLKTPTAVADFLINKLLSFEEHLMALNEEVVYNARRILDNSKNFLDTVSNHLKPLVDNYILQNNQELNYLSLNFKNKVHNLINLNNNNLNNLSYNLLISSKSIINKNKLNINNITTELKGVCNNFINNEKNKLLIYDKTIDLINPQHILNKGYSITYVNNKVVKSKNDVKKGDVITTHLADGKFQSIKN